MPRKTALFNLTRERDLNMATDNSERRNRIVMALGIATIVLFSANLLTALAKQFWPEQANFTMFSATREADTDALAEWEDNCDTDIEIIVGRSIQYSPRRSHRFVVRLPRHRSHSHETDLDREIAEMESAARRLERELSRELRTMQTEKIRFGAVRAIEIARESLHGQNFKIRLHEEGMEDLEATIREALSEMESDLKLSVFELKTGIEEAEADGRRNRKRRFKVRSAN